jgi:hypothetical protein
MVQGVKVGNPKSQQAMSKTEQVFFSFLTSKPEKFGKV